MIPDKQIDLSKDYWTRVFEPSLHSWERGITPNPDVWCNKEIKFGALLDRLSARHPNAFFATGHYARKGWGFSASESPVPLLLRAKDSTKDQTYFLSSISYSSLSRALFPLGDLAKTEVRDIAKEHGLITAERAESMGVCFVGEKGRFREFLGHLPFVFSISHLIDLQRSTSHRRLDLSSTRYPTRSSALTQDYGHSPLEKTLVCRG